MLTKEYSINVFTWQAAVHATALNYTPKVLAAIEERMRTDDETTGTKLVKMVNDGEHCR